jgi:hypothetical protein
MTPAIISDFSMQERLYNHITAAVRVKLCGLFYRQDQTDQAEGVQLVGTLSLGAQPYNRPTLPSLDLQRR